MSNTESIIVGQTKTSSWRKSDTTWTLGLFGTAIGAGVLFFPIRAGFGGLIPILLMLDVLYSRYLQIDRQKKEALHEYTIQSLLQS